MDWGDEHAPPVLLLHGLSSTAHRWARFAEDASAEYRLIAPDARGHGDSSAPDAGYDLETLARDALSVLDALGIHRAAVVGHSMGGRTAIRLTAAEPERVSRLAVVDIGVSVSAEGRRRVHQAVTAAPTRFTSEAEASEHIKAQRPYYPPEEIEQRVRHNLRPAPDGGLTWKYSLDALEKIMKEGRSVDLEPYARAVRCPVLLVWGERSDLLTREAAEQTAEMMGAELAPVPGGHDLINEQPELFARIMLEFLAPWRTEHRGGTL